MSDDLRATIAEWRNRACACENRTYNALTWQAIGIEIRKCADELEAAISAAKFQKPHVAQSDSTGTFCVCGARMADRTAHVAPAVSLPAETSLRLQNIENDWRILRERKWDWHDQNLVVRPFVDALVAALRCPNTTTGDLQNAELPTDPKTRGRLGNPPKVHP